MEVHEVPFVGWFLWVLLCRRSNYLSNHQFRQPAFIPMLIIAAGPFPPAKSRVDCCQLQPTSSHKSGHHGFAEVCNPTPRGAFPGPSACPRWHTDRALSRAPVIVYVGETPAHPLVAREMGASLFSKVVVPGRRGVGHWGCTPSEKIPRPDPRVHRWTRFSGLTQPRFFSLHPGLRVP